MGFFMMVLMRFDVMLVVCRELFLKCLVRVMLLLIMEIVFVVESVEDGDLMWVLLFFVWLLCNLWKICIMW